MSDLSKPPGDLILGGPVRAARKAVHGNYYDGQTLSLVIAELEDLRGSTA